MMESRLLMILAVTHPFGDRAGTADLIRTKEATPHFMDIFVEINQSK